ncbi:H(+)/Cl(-) exchange transporter ClcA [Clostridium thermarum]|uniref:H(+)/Cl(-) exchange transporter ClcA n=1 Tax=Clostridium thermarum TaxID=1716543 RepID=UPI001FADAC36|nr:H(+)/Cl(-) exchange transporter ClcA [Clostridium thermarum]
MKEGVNCSDSYSLLSQWRSFKFKLIGEGVLVGILSGFIVVLYRFAIDAIGNFRSHLLYTLSGNILKYLLWFIVLACLALVTVFALNRDPLIGGSGIPQVQGELTDAVDMNWWRVIILKFVAGVLAIGGGLSLGREGPSIQLGAAAGKGVGRFFKRGKVEEKFLITSGASAGLAAAFNAPLAGVIFSLEELHKNFSPLVLLSAMSSALTADFVSKQFFGLKPVFSINVLEPLPLSHYWLLIIFGIIVGVFGVLFNLTLMKTLKMLDHLKRLLRLVIAFMIAGLMAFVLPQVLGGGHDLIEEASQGAFSLKLLLVILAAKFFFTMVSFGSGTPGGIFLPMLVIGALTGSAFGVISADTLGISNNYVHNFIILGMAGYLTAVVRSPITASILITEMTGSFDHLLSLSIVSIIAYITADLMKSEPIYESLLHRLLKGKKMTSNDERKTVIELPVCIGSQVENKAIREIKWPKHTLLVGIRRGGGEIIPKGDTVIKAGDYLLILAMEADHHRVKEELAKSVSEVISSSIGSVRPD